MTRITIDSNAVDLADDLREMVEQVMEDTINDIFIDLTSSPPEGTPVDTGAARNSWQVDLSDKLAPEVYSQSPYMGRLNDGSSQQSPESFIDTIVDKHAR